MGTIGGFILGVLNIGIVAVLLILLGLLIQWLFSVFGQSLPGEARKFYLLFVLLVCIYMLVSLLLGLPSVRLIGAY